MDITNNNLVAALLDQKVAGAFAGKNYAYVAVLTDNANQWGVGIAVQNEPGFNLITGPDLSWQDHKDAEGYCNAMNEHLGLTLDQAAEIVISSMRKPALKRRRVYEPS